MSFQGIEFTPAMRKLIVNVKQYFDEHKHAGEKATVLAASALGVSESTVKVIMAAFNKQGESGLSWSNADNRGRPSFIIESGIETHVRKLIRDANKSGDQITLDSIAKQLTDTISHKIASSTLWRALLRWGFEFGSGTRSAQLKESERIILKRRQYLREKIANRNADGSTVRPEIYLDESYVNKNHSRDDTWYFGDDGDILGKPTGKGDRFIILNAINQNNWVPHAKLVFKASKKTGDYHASMNWDVFSTWFQEQLLPNIPANSLIILDNAPYHNVLSSDAFPKKSHSLKRLRAWLTHNEIPWKEDMLKAELYELCTRLAPKPDFLLDCMALEKGHTILRTPPYHPELQPIETCWAVVKSHVAKYNDFSVQKIQQLLEEGFQKVTMHTIHGIIKKVRAQEDDYWKEDAVLLGSMENE
jgi:transposase